MPNQKVTITRQIDYSRENLREVLLRAAGCLKPREGICVTGLPDKCTADTLKESVARDVDRLVEQEHIGYVDKRFGHHVDHDANNLIYTIIRVD